MHKQATHQPSIPSGCENIFQDVSEWDRVTQNNWHADVTSSDRISARHVSDFMPVSGRRVSPVVRPVTE